MSETSDIAGADTSASTPLPTEDFQSGQTLPDGATGIVDSGVAEDAEPDGSPGGRGPAFGSEGSASPSDGSGS